MQAQSKFLCFMLVRGQTKETGSRKGGHTEETVVQVRKDKMSAASARTKMGSTIAWTH